MARPTVRKYTNVHPGRSAVEACDTLRVRLDRSCRRLSEDSRWDRDLTRSMATLDKYRELLQHLDQDQLKHLRRSVHAFWVEAANEGVRIREAGIRAADLMATISTEQSKR